MPSSPENKPKEQQYCYIATGLDDLSHMAEGHALKNIKSKMLAQFFWEKIICVYGHIAYIVTDNESEVDSAFDLLIKQYEMYQVRKSAYNKFANRLVEQGHFTIREAIMKECGDYWQDWPKKVRHAFFADKITTHRSTGFSPFYLLYGTLPVLPFDLTEATFMVSGFKKDMKRVAKKDLPVREVG